MNPWNERRMNKPAINTLKQKGFDLDVSALRKLLDTNLEIFNNNGLLEKEAALISALIAHRAHSFRGQYAFRMVRKINISLCRLKELNLVDVIENFLGTIPVYRLEGLKRLNLPTKHNYEYVLVRLQAAAKLLLRIVISCRNCSEAFVKFIESVYFFEISVIFISVCSQLWFICRDLCHKTVLFYNELYVYQKYFRHQTQKWLKEKDLTETLEQFLGDDWQQEFIQNAKVPLKTVEVKQNFANYSFDDIETESKEIDSSQTMSRFTMNKSKEIGATDTSNKSQVTAVQKATSTQIDEIGVQISRPTATHSAAAATASYNSKWSYLDKLKKPLDIRQFMNREQNLRISKQPKYTGKLNDKQFNQLYENVNQIIRTQSHAILCVKKFKQLWIVTLK